MNRHTLNENLTTVHLISTRQNLYQRRFTRSIVPQQPHHFAGIQADGHVVHRLYPTKGYRNVVHVYQGRFPPFSGHPDTLLRYSESTQTASTRTTPTTIFCSG